MSTQLSTYCSKITLQRYASSGAEKRLPSRNTGS